MADSHPREGDHSTPSAVTRREVRTLVVTGDTHDSASTATTLETTNSVSTGRQVGKRRRSDSASLGAESGDTVLTENESWVPQFVKDKLSNEQIEQLENYLMKRRRLDSRKAGTAQLLDGATSSTAAGPITHKQAATSIAKRLDPEWSGGSEGADGEAIYNALESARYVPATNNAFAAMKFRKAVLKSGPIPPIPKGKIYTTYDITSFCKASRPQYTKPPTVSQSGPVAMPGTKTTSPQSVPAERVKLFVRKCHERLDKILGDAISALRNHGGSFQGVITGTPGIGKSMYGLQYLVGRIWEQKSDQSFDIVYQINTSEVVQKEKVHTWAFMRDGSIFYWKHRFQDEADDFVDNLSLRDYYIADAMAPAESSAATLMVTSPCESRTKHHSKIEKPTTLTMPIFSMAEMRAFRTVCMRGMDTDDDRMLEFLMATFGCSPRNVFAAARRPENFIKALAELEQSIRKVELGNVAARCRSSDQDALPHTLFHVMVKPDGKYDMTYTEYASHFAWRLVVAKLRHASDVLFDAALNTGRFNASFGLEFESACIRILSEAKVGRYGFRSICTMWRFEAHCVSMRSPAVDLITQLLDAGIAIGSRPKSASRARDLLDKAKVVVEKSEREDLGDIVTLQETKKSECVGSVAARRQLRSKGQLLDDIKNANIFFQDVAEMMGVVRDATAKERTAAAKANDIIDAAIGKFEAKCETRGVAGCGVLRAMFEDGTVEFQKRDVLHVNQRDMVDNAAEFAKTHCKRFIVPPVGFAAFDAFSLEGLHQMTLASQKPGPGWDPWQDAYTYVPAVPEGNVAMSTPDAWYYIPRLWCEMQSAHHGHTGYPWAHGGEVVLPMNYVVPYSTDGIDGEVLSESYASFELTGTLPRPQTFTGIGKHDVNVRVTIVPRVLGVPRMQDWAGHDAPTEIVREQRQTYIEIREALGQENFTHTHDNVQLTLRERGYWEAPGTSHSFLLVNRTCQSLKGRSKK